MRKWVRRIRGAIGMGLTWAAAWALFGILIGVTSLLTPSLPWEVFVQAFDAPVLALALPGFFGGAFFSVVLGIAGRRRRFDALSIPRFASWGAVGGLMLGLFPAALVAVELATLSGSAPFLWKPTAAASGPLMLLSAASASRSLMLARLSDRRALLDADAEPADVGLTERESHELLGRRG